MNLRLSGSASGGFQGFRPWAAALAALAALTLAACATNPAPRIEYREVKVAIPVKCAVNLGEDPAYPDTDDAIKAAPDIAEKVRLLLAGRFLRIGREAELKAKVAGCS